MSEALVVLSGGQDSTTCLYWAIARFGKTQVTTLTFDYGQRHRIELECARQVADFAGVDNTILPIDTFAMLGGNALIDSALTVDNEVDARNSQPNTFVPGRNLIFLTFAAAFAYQRGIKDIVGGMAQTDYSGYPDCRENTLQALQRTLQLGLEYPITLHTPLMFKTKRETVELARDLGALEALAYTHTCYNGQRPPCGQCPACVLRAKGFAEAGLVDPLVVNSK